MAKILFIIDKNLFFISQVIEKNVTFFIPHYSSNTNVFFIDGCLEALTGLLKEAQRGGRRANSSHPTSQPLTLSE